MFLFFFFLVDLMRETKDEDGGVTDGLNGIRIRNDVVREFDSREIPLSVFVISHEIHH